MRPLARFRTPNGQVVELGHGDLIGRLESAALQLSDPRISEVHAMISLRGTGLQLLALRGRFTVKGKPLAGVELQRGMMIHLAKDLSLEVVELALPERVPALRVAGTQLRVLTGVCSLFGEPKVELRPGFHASALAHVWVCSEGLQLRQPGVDDLTLRPGDKAVVAGVPLEVAEMALRGDGQYVTTARGAVAAPLDLVTRYESAHIFRAHEPALLLSGISARILSELVSFGGPASWSTVASEIWPSEPPDALRAKWDVNLGRLRKKLEGAGIRADLVRSDGRGNVELSLERDDTVRDES